MMNKIAKSLDGNDYSLDAIFDFKKFVDDHKKHYPDRVIAGFSSFGINTRVCVEYAEGSSLFLLNEIDIVSDLNDDRNLAGKYAYVRDIEFDCDDVIITAVHKKQKPEKLKFVNTIIDKIDYNADKGFFVEMLCNVFTKERLLEMLNSDMIEILSFNGLMYLKVGDKAFRL